MAYGGIQVVGPMQINVGNVSPIIIDQVEGSLLNLQPRLALKGTDGDIDPSYVAFESFAPMFSGSTDKLKTMLANVGINGYIPTNNGVAVYFRQVDLTTGLRKSGANHDSATFASSLIVPRSLRVTQGEQGAKLNFDIIGVNAAGTTNPVVYATGIALPALAGVSELFTMGPIKIGGVNYEGMQSYEIDFGIKLAVKSGTGNVYPQIVYIEERRPKITIKTDDSSLLNALTVTGTSLAAGTTVLYLRSFAASGIRTADGTAAHISFTMTKGLAYATQKAANHPGEYATSIVLEPVYDQTNAIIQINTATAIT